MFFCLTATILLAFDGAAIERIALYCPPERRVIRDTVAEIERHAAIELDGSYRWTQIIGWDNNPRRCVFYVMNTTVDWEVWHHNDGRHEVRFTDKTGITFSVVSRCFVDSVSVSDPEVENRKRHPVSRRRGIGNFK